MAEWGALLRRCPGKPDRGFKSLPLRQRHSVLALVGALVSLWLAPPATSASASVAPQISPVASCTQFHQAKPNDSWTRLSARFETPLKALLALNSASVETAIFIGDKICVSDRAVSAPIAVVVPTERYTRKQVRAIIREVWPDDAEENAIFVATRESNLVPHVVGGKNDCCFGLFQMYWLVHKSWLTRSGVTDPSQLLDPRVNAQAAYELYRRNGNSWRPWWTSSWRP